MSRVRLCVWRDRKPTDGRQKFQNVSEYSASVPPAPHSALLSFRNTSDLLQLIFRALQQTQNADHTINQLKSIYIRLPVTLWLISKWSYRALHADHMYSWNVEPLLWSLLDTKSKREGALVYALHTASHCLLWSLVVLVLSPSCSKGPVCHSNTALISAPPAV